MTTAPVSGCRSRQSWRADRSQEVGPCAEVSAGAAQLKEAAMTAIVRLQQSTPHAGDRITPGARRSRPAMPVHSHWTRWAGSSLVVPPCCAWQVDRLCPMVTCFLCM